MALDGSWTMEEIRRCYDDLVILKNEDGVDELGFRTLEIAELYCEHFCMIGHILQLNENKLALHMLGQIMNMAEKEGLLSEADFMTLSEREVMDKLEASLTGEDRLSKYYRTFRSMTKIEHTAEALGEDYFCVNLKVKLRYINPLVLDPRVKPEGDKAMSLSGLTGQSVRLSDISEKGRRIIEDFKSYSDTPYGCAKLV